MKDTSPAFQYYPKDFLSDDKVALMNLKEVGAYWLLLSYCWTENGLKNDQEYLKKLCKNDPEWEQVWKQISNCFFLKNAKLHNRRLDEERKKQKDFREKMTESGKIGAKKRWGGHSQAKNKNSQAINKKWGGHKKSIGSDSSSISNLQSSSSNNKDKENIKRKDDSQIQKEFEDFWECYPRHIAKIDAEKSYRALRKKETVENIARATNGYNDFLKAQRLNKNFNQEIMYPATFLRNERYKDFIDFKYQPKL